MKPAEFRANAAGYLDGATVLVRTVAETFKVGQSQQGPDGRPLIACPKAIYDELMDAEKHLQKVAGWLLAPDTFGLDP